MESAKADKAHNFIPNLSPFNPIDLFNRIQPNLPNLPNQPFPNPKPATKFSVLSAFSACSAVENSYIIKFLEGM